MQSTIHGGTGSVTNDAGATITYTGTTQASTAKTTVPVTNNGTITVVRGMLVSGPLTLASGGTVAIGVAAVGGANPSFGQLVLGQATVLAGTFAIQTASGSIPTTGSDFTAVSGTQSGTQSATFATVTGAQLTGEHWVLWYTPTALTLTAAAG